MDAGFIQYLREVRGFQPGDTIATKQQYDAMYKQYLKDTGGGSNFQPTAVAITNPVNTNQVVPFVTTSPNSVQPFPQERFKEGPVDSDGNQLVFDPMTGTYFPGTNRATQTVVQPQARAMSRPEEIMAFMNLNGAAAKESPSFFSRIFGGVASSPTPTPTPMPSPTPAAVTNAPAPVDLSTPEGIRAAWQSGRLSDAEAVRMLRGQP
jgi:hypothetical protein